MYKAGKEEIEAFARAIMSRDFFKINGSGQEVQHFDDEWRRFVGARYSLTMTSGFAALTSALIGMGVGPGDEVIVPAYTYIASALAVTATGAIPVIADVDETLTIDPADVEKKISKHTKVVMPVHIQGFPSNLGALKKLSEKYGFMILEDACQADGGSYRGKRLGTVGDAGAYSFNYFKIITSGEGGALVTDDRKIYERALIYHDAAAVAFFGNQLDGINEPLFGGSEFRVSDLTGAMLREQLKRLPSLLHDLRKNRNALAERVCGTGKAAQAPSNDIDGDCGTTLSLRFGTAEECRAYQKKCADRGVGSTVPIDTGKHVYTNWTQIMEKRGAMHPAMDPFKMEANRGLNMDYSPDMCKKTLDLLSRTLYIAVSPDWSEADLDQIAAVMNS
ncbi:MAG: aminotransferase class I/II-fold pyridoxal phosphate-dependent enzyme [Clostridia bacterium]|nr:aminotransferase class I/II-fold pyridoxal phosphate-dependent enzyme [Clostridia bacterium]